MVSHLASLLTSLLLSDGLTGTNDAPISPKPTSTPVERYIDNLNFFMHSLTSPDSPYAVADTPVSIVLIACQPIVPRMIPAWNAPDAVRWLVPERQREFRDAALQVGKEWKEKEHSEENKTGWKVEVLDFWSAMVQDAQGEEDALLAKYFTYVTPGGSYGQDTEAVKGETDEQ